MSETSVKIIKNEIRCRDDTESMQQSSATPSLHLGFLGVAEDCSMHALNHTLQ